MTTINTPEGIRHYNLCQLKLRLKMEAHGMSCHGPSARSQAADYFGCKSKKRKIADQVAEILPQIEALIENSLAAKKYRGAGLYNCCKDLEPPNWSGFNWFEIAPLEWLPEHDCYEQIIDKSDVHLAEIWSVFGHLHDGGVECITDCNTQKQAEAIVELFEREHIDEMRVAAAIRDSKTEAKH